MNVAIGGLGRGLSEQSGFLKDEGVGMRLPISGGGRCLSFGGVGSCKLKLVGLGVVIAMHAPGSRLCHHRVLA